MAIQLTGESLNRKKYQDDTNYNLQVDVRKDVQPVRRKINGQTVTQHILVEEYIVRDVTCVAPNACSTTKDIESPVLAKCRLSGPVNDPKIAAAYALLQKAVSGSGNAGSPVLSAVKSW